MRTYKIGLYYEESGTILVEANSDTEAEQLVRYHMANSGLDELDLKLDGRDYGTTISYVQPVGTSADISFKDFTTEQLNEIEEL